MKTFLNIQGIKFETSAKPSVLDIYNELPITKEYAICAFSLRQSRKQIETGKCTVTIQPLTDYKKSSTKHLLTRLACLEVLAYQANTIVQDFTECTEIDFSAYKVTKNTIFVLTDGNGKICRELNINSEAYKELRKRVKAGYTAEKAAAIAFGKTILVSVIGHLAKIVEKGKTIDQRQEVAVLERLFGGSVRKAASMEEAQSINVIDTAEEKARKIKVAETALASVRADIKRLMKSFETLNAEHKAGKIKEDAFERQTKALNARLENLQTLCAEKKAKLDELLAA